MLRLKQKKEEAAAAAAAAAAAPAAENGSNSSAAAASDEGEKKISLLGGASHEGRNLPQAHRRDASAYRDGNISAPKRRSYA